MKLNNEIARLKKELSEWKFSVSKISQEKDNLLKEIEELTQIKIKLEQDIKTYVEELDQYENESKIMDTQIKSLNIQIVEYQTKNKDLTCEICRLNTQIKNLTLELENLKKQKLTPIKEVIQDKNKIMSDAIKSFIRKWLIKYKIKLLVRLILKRKYDKLMERNKKINVEVKTKAITPNPENRIKIVKRNSTQNLNVEEIPGKVSYKRRNEIKK